MILSSMAGVRYVEHENANAYRNYPFSETADVVDSDGSPMAADVFVDAMLFPVVEECRPLYLESVSFSSGKVVVSDGTVTVSGVEDGGAVELYDGIGRHAGTMVCGPGWGREAATARDRTFGAGASFAPSACCPVVYRGVVSLHDASGEGQWRTTRRDLELVGDDFVRPVLTRTRLGYALRFDVQYDTPVDERGGVSQLVIATTGKTVFDVVRVGDSLDSPVLVSAPPISREDVCWQAHREDAVSVVADACSNDVECPEPVVTVKNDFIELCPDEIGNVRLISEDGIGYGNPVKIATVKGDVSAPRPQVVDGMTADEIFMEAQKMLERATTVGNGIQISFPGINNGK